MKETEPTPEIDKCFVICWDCGPISDLVPFEEATHIRTTHLAETDHIKVIIYEEDNLEGIKHD